MHCLYATDKLEMLASPILPSKNLNMSCHMNISGIPRYLSSCCHLLPTFFYSFFLTWCGLHGIFSLPEKTIKVTAEVTIFCKIQLGLMCEILSRGLLSPTCALFTLNHNFHPEWATGAWHRKPQGDQWVAFPGATWGHACFPLDGDFKAIASGLRIIPWIYLKSWF